MTTQVKEAVATTSDAVDLPPVSNGSPVGLHSKIAHLQQTLEQVEKRGHADVSTSGGGSYSYDYILESDLMAAIRPKLGELGVAVYYSDEVVHREDNLVSVKVTLTLADGETGETFAMSAVGDGTDKGDKAANKAKTSAMRYLLWKWMLVPSDIDPEHESVPRRSSGASGASDDGLPKNWAEINGEAAEYSCQTLFKEAGSAASIYLYGSRDSSQLTPEQRSDIFQKARRAMVALRAKKADFPGGIAPLTDVVAAWATVLDGHELDLDLPDGDDGGYS